MRRYKPDRALQVIRGIGSRNLRIIFDPVNLLCPDNADERERVIGEAMDGSAMRSPWSI